MTTIFHPSKHPAYRVIRGVVLMLVLIWGMEIRTVEAQTFPHIESPLQFTLDQAPPDSFLVDSLPLAPPYRYLLHQVDIQFEEERRSIIAVMDYLVRIQQRRATEQPVVNLTVPYYFQQDVEEIQGLSGTIYRNDGSWKRLDSTHFSRINLNARYDLYESDPVPLDSGEVVEYSYTVRRAYIEQLRSIPLRFRVPSVKNVVRLRNPDFLRYQGIQTGQRIPLRYQIQRVDTSSVPKIFTFPQPEPLIYEYWWVEEQPAMPKLPFVLSPQAHRPEFNLQMAAFGRPRQPLENSWALVMAQVRRELPPLDKGKSHTPYFYPDIGLDSLTDSHERMNRIYRYLNEHAVYNEQQRAIPADSIAAVYQKSPVDLATINFALVRWLRHVGITSYPVFTASRSSGGLQAQLPSHMQLDAMFAMVIIEQDTLLLDASSPFGVPDRLPIAYNTGKGIILKEHDFQWHQIQPENSVFSLDLDIDAHLDPDGNLSGTIQGTAEGYQAQWIQQKRSEGQDESEILRTLLLDGYPEVAWKTIQLEESEHAVNELSFTGEFEIENYGRSFRNGVEFRPLVTGVLRRNPFNDTTRTVPITFDAPEKIHMDYRITIPSELAMPSLSKDHSLRFPGAHLWESYTRSNRVIGYSFDIELSQTQYPSNRYADLRNLYRRWVELSSMRWLLERK
ncbi:MAG: hypothetical protein ACQETE_07330 [Bacteroidota bacterium]